MILESSTILFLFRRIVMCKRSVLVGELLVVALLLAGGAVAHAGGDVFSVNFFYKPWPWPDGDTHNITLED